MLEASGPGDVLPFLAGVNKPNPEDPKLPQMSQIPPELTEEMRYAADFEQLRACWTKVGEIYGFDQHEFYHFQRREQQETDVFYQPTPMSLLCVMYNYFLVDGIECDGPLEEMKRQGLLSTVKQFGFPLEFLFHTVRMGAIKVLEKRAVESHQNALNIILTRGAPNDDMLQATVDIGGFNWANESLRSLADQRERGVEDIRRGAQEDVDGQQIPS